MASCHGNCENCIGCAKELLLTQGEVDLLTTLGQIPFLPIARRSDDMVPVYLEDAQHTPDQCSLFLQALEQKGLVSLDYDIPLKGFDMTAYAGYPIHGSVALTQRGQTVLELLELQGIQ